MKTSKGLLGIAIALAACSSGGGKRAFGTGGTFLDGAAGGMAGDGSQSHDGGDATVGTGGMAAGGAGGVAAGGAGGGSGGKTSDGGGDARSATDGAVPDAGLDAPSSDGGTDDAGRDTATGGFGGGGAGGMGGGTGGTTGTGGLGVTCSGTLAQATAPVVVAATLGCSGGQYYSQIEQVSVAAGTGTDGFVSLGYSAGSTPSFFFDISSTGVQAQPIRSDGNEINMATNAAGVLGVVETGRVNGNAVWLTRAPAGSTPPWTESSITDSMWPSAPIASAIGPDGAEYAAFAVSPDMTLGLATRPAGASAFTIAKVSPSTTVNECVLAVDTAGARHVLYWIDGQGLVDSQPGQPLANALPSTSTTSPTSMQGVRPNGLGVALSLILPDAVHVVRRRADAGFDDIAIPATPPTSYSVPGSMIPCPSFQYCATVTQLGDSSRGGALAEASDGTLWLATVRDHVDRTARYQLTTSEACQCEAPLAPADDRSTSTLVIQRIAAGATAPSGILWSYDLKLSPWTAFTVASSTMSASFSGSRLYLAILGVDLNVHYFVIDTTGM